MQQIEICKQQGPSAHDMKLLQGWLKSAGGNRCALRGPGWDAGKYKIVVVETRTSIFWFCPDIGSVIDLNDGLAISYLVYCTAYVGRNSRYVKDNFNYHKLILKNDFPMDEELGVTEYRDAGISTAADIVCTLLAPLLTTIPMFVLYTVKDIEKRLGIIMGFTIIFSIRCVSCLSIEVPNI